MLELFRLYTWPILGRWRVHRLTYSSRVGDKRFASSCLPCRYAFEGRVEGLCDYMPISHVAGLLRLNRKTLKEID
jgi:hypothetical protein